MLNFVIMEQEILNHRGDSSFMDKCIGQLSEIKRKLDWQINKFLEEKCRGIHGINRTDLNSADPVYRYYNFKRDEYSKVERMIRVAKAFK